MFFFHFPIIFYYFELNNKIIDDYKTEFGIRTIYFDSLKGFFLNNKAVKIKGVCNHHDLGCLGAAVNVRAIERQLEIMKKMGVNAIRTAHNPPAPELLDLCDRMGFLVMDEIFDMWKKNKAAGSPEQSGTGKDFTEITRNFQAGQFAEVLGNISALRE